MVPNSSSGLVVRNAAATGDASLILDSNAQNGVVELKALAGGGVQMNTIFQFMSFNTTNGIANLAIEPNIGGSNNGELIFGYGFVNLSDKGHQSPCRCARSAGHGQGGQSASGLRGRRRLRSRGRHFRRRSEAFGCFRFRHLLRGEPLDVLRRLALHLRRPLPRSLQQGLHFAGPSDDLRSRHLVGRRRQSRESPGDAQRAVQPVAAAPQHIHRLVLRDASRRGRSAGGSSGDDRLRGLDAAFAETTSQSRGPGRVQSVVAQGLAGIAAPSSLSGRKDGLVNSLGGRGKGTPS